MATHALFETASGYAIFQVNFKEDIGSNSKQVQDSLNDLAKFGKMVSLVSFSPFRNAAHALENSNDVSEGMHHSIIWYQVISGNWRGMSPDTGTRKDGDVHASSASFSGLQSHRSQINNMFPVPKNQSDFMDHPQVFSTSTSSRC